MSFRSLLLGFLIATTALGVSSCIKAGSCTSRPDIGSNIGISMRDMRQNGRDSFTITFDVKDGGRDFGSSTNPNVFLIDSRTGNIIENYKVPVLDRPGSGDCIDAAVSVRVISHCCINELDMSACDAATVLTDTLSYKVFVRDENGNVSDTVETEKVVLRCR